MHELQIGLVGNPNSGKTTLFNALTGARQHVGNWPGVTVDRKSGECFHEGGRIEVIDLPGIYSLSAVSLDEQVARDYLLSGGADIVVNIVDASNLERNLYLTLQLLEMRVPLVVALNMMDLAVQKRVRIDPEELSRQLGCPVVPLVASRSEGVKALKGALTAAAGLGGGARYGIPFPPEIRAAITDLVPLIAPALETAGLDPEWAAVKLLEGDPHLRGAINAGVREVLDRHLRAIEEQTGEEADILVADSRYGAIGRVVGASMKREARLGRSLSDRIDRIVLNRFLGIPVFLVAMYLMFMVTINIGGAFIDFFDKAAGALCVDGFGHVLGLLGTPEWLRTLLASGLGGGIRTMTTFIPPIGFMFLCLCLLEDSGYMARAAFVMDRFMRLIGLPGKAFVPMLVGFGCNVPATMATRTLENQRDRTLSIMMIPFMSCGARLPVYALFAAAFFPVGGQNMVFGLYLLGIAFAVFTGLILKTTLLRGSITPFVMELPPYHIPTARGVLLHAWERLRAFLFRAGKLLVPVVMVLSFLNSVGTDGTYGNENNGRSVLSSIGRAITPAFGPMGIRPGNWPATVGIFTGVFAKEAVVATLNSAYSRMHAPAEEAAPEPGFPLKARLAEAFATIPANLKGVAGKVLDPLGLSIGDVSAPEEAAKAQSVDVGTFGAMVRLFDGRIGAFAYLVFILLYFPCVAAMAAVYRETTLGWTAFVGIWTTGLAYLAAVAFYQAGTFGQHPTGSMAWFTGIAAILVSVHAVLRHRGLRDLGPAQA